MTPAARQPVRPGGSAMTRATRQPVRPGGLAMTRATRQPIGPCGPATRQPVRPGGSAMPPAARQPGAGRGARPGSRGQRGIALLEAMLAIVILGIGLLGTVGMQARAYSALADAGMRAEATLASEKLIGVMSADVASLSLYNLAENGVPNARLAPWVQETKAAIPGAVLAVAVADQPALNRYQVDISIRWQRKARGEANRHRVTSYIAR